MKKELLDFAKEQDAPFEIIFGFSQYPEVDPNWVEPEGFEPGVDDYPVTGNMIQVPTIGWKDKYDGVTYAQYMRFNEDDGLSVEDIYNLLEDSHSFTMDPIKRIK